MGKVTIRKTKAGFKVTQSSRLAGRKKEKPTKFDLGTFKDKKKAQRQAKLARQLLK